MRSGLSPADYLRVVARKKPRLQDLLDRVEELTREDIEALPEPRWVRDALAGLKRDDGRTRSDYVAERLRQVIEAEELAAQQPSPTYEVRIWDAVPGFVGTESQDRISDLPHWQIEISTGDSVMVVDGHHIRVGDSVIRLSERMMQVLVSSSKLVGYMTLQNYRGFHRALLNRKHGNP